MRLKLIYSSAGIITRAIKALVILFFLSSLLIFPACQQKESSAPISLVNTAHLDHLYTEVITPRDTIGAIWIYCEAPDYKHVGDEDEGFTCVDDVARALVFYCELVRQQPSEEVYHKIEMLTRFLMHMYAGNGFFYNFMFQDGRINTTHINSEAKPAWWTWRAFLGLVSAYALPGEQLADIKPGIKPVLDRVVSNMLLFCPDPNDTLMIQGLTIPSCLAGSMGADQAADILLGLVRYQQLFPEAGLKTPMENLAGLIKQIQYGSADKVPFSAFLSWQNIWHAWGNRQAYALLEAGRIMNQKEWIEAGLAEAENFYPILLRNGFLNEFSVSSADSTLEMNNTKIFPQIAYGMEPMILASIEAFGITGDTTLARTAGELASWFFGNNPAQTPMYDPATGRGYDGIVSEKQINKNAGAESTIEALLAIQAIEKSKEARAVLTHYLSTQAKHH